MRTQVIHRIIGFGLMIVTALTGLGCDLKEGEGSSPRGEPPVVNRIMSVTVEVQALNETKECEIDMLLKKDEDGKLKYIRKIVHDAAETYVNFPSTSEGSLADCISSALSRKGIRSKVKAATFVKSIPLTKREWAEKQRREGTSY